MVVLSQNDSISAVKKLNISVVSADRMNVVYRGIPNPISVMVPNDKYFSVIAPGLENKGNGKFILKVGPGKEVEIQVRFKNEEGKPVVEKHVFRIKGLPSPIGLLNDENCGNCLVLLKRDDVKKSIISIKMLDFLMFDFDSDFFKVTSFDVVLSENKTINVEGNFFNEEALKEINKLKKGDIFVIDNIQYGSHCAECELKRVFPIKVILAD